MEVQTWCIDNGFELIELNPELETDSDTEDDFVETTGVKRIVQALHAHTWPNLQMKGIVSCLYTDIQFNDKTRYIISLNELNL